MIKITDKFWDDPYIKKMSNKDLYLWIKVIQRNTNDKGTLEILRKKIREITPYSKSDDDEIDELIKQIEKLKRRGPKLQKIKL